MSEFPPCTLPVVALPCGRFVLAKDAENPVRYANRTSAVSRVAKLRRDGHDVDVYHRPPSRAFYIEVR